MISEQHLISLYWILEQKLCIMENYGLREPTEENWHRQRGDYEKWKVRMEEHEAQEKQRREGSEREEREFYEVFGEGAIYTD